jgi:hypothetical protein
VTTTTECLYCIDGLAPDTNQLLGECFRVCTFCRPACPCCEGQGRFPSWTNDMVRFIATYNANRLAPELCHTCGGVTGARSITDEEEENQP